MRLIDHPPAKPVDPAEFENLLLPLHVAGPLAVAVSGGGDSFALLHLAAEWAEARGETVFALTVDHGIRPESGTEAERVGQWSRELGVKHTILRAGPVPASGNLQEWAREERMRLLCEWLRRDGRPVPLLVAHSRDDQAETLLINLARGSGVDGLCGMAASAIHRGVRVLRPLLDISRERLRATLVARGRGWFEDPGNEDERYARVRARRALARLSPLGIDARRLAGTAAVMARARHALEAEVDRQMAEVRFGTLGEAEFDAARIAALPPEIGLRLLRRILRALAGKAHPPRERNLLSVHAWIGGAGGPRGRTLHGCGFCRRAGGRILVTREARDCEAPVRVVAGEERAWDRRWMIRVESGGACEAGALGRMDDRKFQPKPEGWRRVAPPVRASLPALRQAGRVVAVPPLGAYLPGHEGCASAKLRMSWSEANPFLGVADRL